MKQKNGQSILQGSLWRAMLSIAVPVVISSFLQTMYNLTDTYWLGQIGKEHLAAINLVSPVQAIVVNFGGGITVAGSVLISQRVGAGKQREASHMAGQILGAALLFAVVCAVIGSLATPAIVDGLGATGATRRYGVEYLRLVILDMPFLFAINVFQAVRQAKGDTVRPMLLNMAGVATNMLLDPLFMVVWNLNATGAALATLLSKVGPACLALWMLCDKKEAVRVEMRGFRFDREALSLIGRIGLPTALGGSAMQFGFLLMTRSVYAFGVNAMAAYGISNKVNGLISLPSNAIGSAVGTIVGQNVGAGQMKRAEKGYLLSMACAVTFLLTGGLLLSRRWVAGTVVRVFSSDREVVTMATDFLSLMAFWCWTNGVYNATTGLFLGTGHTEITMAVDASRLWVFRFATLYVCRDLLHLGVRSVWLSVVVSNGIATALLFALYLTGVWKKNRLQSPRSGR